MTKLEILSMSFSHGLQVRDCKLNKTHELTGLHEDGYTLDRMIFVPYEHADYQYFKPIYYNLDLTQPIHYEGKEIVPIDRLLHTYGVSGYFMSIKYVNWLASIAYRKDCKIVVGGMPFEIIQWCIEHKINLWLPEGEYINVNDLKTNPYK